MWLRRSAYDFLCGQLKLATAQNDRLIETLVRLQTQQPIIVEPPPTAEIVKETIGGVATIVNGWRADGVPAQLAPQISFDNEQEHENLDDFMPPWENMGPPTRGGWINPPSNGSYTPYVPGAGNVVPPEGGTE